MSSKDRIVRSLPAWSNQSSQQPPSGSPSSPPPSSAVVSVVPGRRGGGGLSLGLLWRAFRRHWWQALLIWALGTAGLLFLVDRGVRTTYEAASTIEVERGQKSSTEEFEIFKETQAQRLSNPELIARVLTDHPDIVSSAEFKQASDPQAAIREHLKVSVLPRTNLIRVSMTSESPSEATAIVDALVATYLAGAQDHRDENEQKRLYDKLVDARTQRQADIQKQRDLIAQLVRKVGAADVNRAREREAVSVQQYGVLSREVLDTDLELIEAQNRLDHLGTVTRLIPIEDSKDPDPEVVVAFYANPQVAEVRSKLEKAREAIAEAKKVARSPDDRSVTLARSVVEDAQRQLDTLWTNMSPGLIKTRQAAVAREAERKELEDRIAALKTKLAQLNERLDKINERSKSSGSDELALEFARQDLARSEAVLETVTKSLDQAEFQARAQPTQFRVESKARARSASDIHQRTKAMVAAPLGMLLGVLACLALVELRAARVHDPDDLPRRLQLPVLGVVPTLPRARMPGQGALTLADEPKARRNLDQFIQSLDHLRVAICSGQDAWGQPRRSVVITSACGGEGKTTLAAQLAERCVNAGLLTLLVDADIRNPSLSRMFDHLDSRGLVNLLRGETSAEEAISVIGGAGGFHFLPAGSPRVDPSRLLEDERLSRFLASARESFDIVLVDCPPILPVPDALTIGRWVDGAVMAVRFDESRYPLVERAHGRLTAVGVPVIGAVLSGVRGSTEAYYGTYHATDDQGTPSY